MNESRISEDVGEASRVLLSGGIIGMPTETVYGLAAIALDESAVSRIFNVKGRPTNHPLIVHLSPEADPSMWGEMTAQALLLAKAFWPGPLTLLVQRTDLVPDWVTGGRDTVALRVPSHPAAMELLRHVDTGVVAPSANKFGKVSPTTAEHVLQDLGDEVDLILDGGPCQIGVESTIVECIDDTVSLLRSGAVTDEEIESVLNTQLLSDHGEARAPGMLLSHYSPDAEIVLVDSYEEALNTKKVLERDEVTACIMFHEDVNEYATRLYEDLRDADRKGFGTVIAVLPPRIGIGTAVRDRLAKAATR